MDVFEFIITTKIIFFSIYRGFILEKQGKSKPPPVNSQEEL